VTGNRAVDRSWQYDYAHITPPCSNFTWLDNRVVTIDANYQITGLGVDMQCG
jgi:hypothetical protein